MTGTTGAKTILVVEEEADLRLTTVAALSELGYDVLEARDGASALAILGRQGQAIDLVFSELGMRFAMDGFELAREVQDRYPHIGILLTSGSPGMLPNKAGVQGSEFPVLQTPYNLVDLAEAVRTTLDQ